VVNLLKILTIVSLASMMSVFHVVENQDVATYEYDDMMMDDNMLSSNRFTQQDTYDDAQIDDFTQLYQIEYTEEARDTLGYRYSIENDRYILYFEPMSFSVLLYDKVNDYMMSSRAEFQGISGERENNTATRNLLNSGLWLSYVRKANVSRATETTVSLYELADVDYINNGSVNETQTQLSTFQIVDGSYDEDEVSVSVLETNQTLIATVNAYAIDVSLNIHLSLNDRGLEVLSLPVIGMIHHVNHQGFYVSVDEGAELSELEAVFWSSRTRYYRTQLNFTVRPIYKAIINAAGDGRDQIPESLTNKDYKATYVMLGDNANYVGIANDYQAYLVDRQQLIKQTVDQMPFLLQVLMGDQTPSFLGTTYLEMTSSREAEAIIQTLLEQGVQPSVISLYGWSRDGAISQTPYRMRDVYQLDDLENYMMSLNIDVLRHQDYVISSELSERVGLNRDVALNYSRLKMTQIERSLNNQSIDQYFLYPESSQSFSSSDDLSSAYLTSIGRLLYSYYDRGFYDRIDTRNIYTSILESYETLMLNQPSLYALKYTDYYTHMPIMHSQYYFYTDNVPFVPIVLSGMLPVFSGELNFNAIGEVYRLMMLDFGMYQNYIVTKEPTQTMRFTRSNIFFTTHFDVFEDEINQTFNQFKLIYDQIGFEQIVSRDVLELGIVLVTYANNKKLLVNYTNDSFTYMNQEVEGLSAEVII